MAPTKGKKVPKGSKKREPRGPASYRNWRAANDGLPLRGIYEAGFYSDPETTFIGELSAPTLGPVAVLNGMRMLGGHGGDPVLFIRVNVHLSYDPLPMDKTDDSSFTGADMSDEIACLFAVLLGVRLLAGGAVREAFGGDLERPRADPSRPAMLTLPARPWRRLPNVVGERRVKSNALLDAFPRLAPESAVALVRAARSYRDALWIAETEPELAWLLFVAAIECAAEHHAVSVGGSPAERLRDAEPELATILEHAGGPELLSQVADKIANHFKATAKFLDFTTAFLPPVPTPRPPYGGVDWSDANWIRKALTKVYQHRSKALHSAIPIPPPMCAPPFMPSGNEPALEIPVGMATQTGGGTWLGQDAPLTLQTFEYITRNVLLRWWGSLAPATPA